MLRKVGLVCCAFLLASCASIGVPQPTPTVAPTLTPSQTVPVTAVAEQPTRTLQPTATDTRAPTSTTSPNPSSTGTITSTPTDTFTPSPTLSETPTTTATLTPSHTPTDTPTPSVTPTPTDTVRPSNTPLPRLEPTATPSDTSTPTTTPSHSPTPSDTFTPEPTDTFTPTATFTPSETFTPEPSATLTASLTSSATATTTATTTPSITASSTITAPSTTPSFEPSATATREPFAMTPANTWTPFPTGTETPTVTFVPGPTLDATPDFVTLAADQPTPEQGSPSATAIAGDATEETFLPTPTQVYPTVQPVAPPPTLAFAPLPLNTTPLTIGALPFQIGPGVTGADFAIPDVDSDYQPFQLANPLRPNERIETDEFGTMYWVVDGERRGMPAPFTSFGPDSLENSDRLVRAAAWSPDGNSVAFIVDNPMRGGAEDGVWWWNVDEGRAYQVMHNCRRQVRNCPDFVNAAGDPYVNPPADQPEDPNTGWYAQSVSWSPDGTRLLARLRIRDDQRLAFIVLPATMDENYKKQRGAVCKYELSDWAADGQSVLVAGRDAQNRPALGRLENPLLCDSFVPLGGEAVDDVRVTPIAGVSAVPEGVIAGSEFEANQQLQVNSTTGGLNLRTQPSQSAGVFRYVLNGEYVRVLAGPYEAEGYRWWQVQTSEGTQGWMVGSSGVSQLLVPAP